MIQFPKKNSPRWLIFIIDIAIVTCAIVLAYLLRFNFNIPPYEFEDMLPVIPMIVIIRGVSFIIFKTYSGIIRYTSSQDTNRIFMVVLCGSILFALINLVRYLAIDTIFVIPFSVIIIEFLLSVVILIGSRFTVKMFYLELQHSHKAMSNVLIYGAGESGIITKRTIDRDAGTKLKVVAFLDDDKTKSKKSLEGAEIYHTSKLEDIILKNNIEELIISIQQNHVQAKKNIVDVCLKHGVKVLNVPPVKRWINGELSFNQIKTIKIDELLGRAPIKIDNNTVRNYINNETILITGAAGSIGSELVRQVLSYHPKKVMLLDQAESALYDLDIELSATYGNKKQYEIVVADITKRDRLTNVFEYLKPTIVFHAAAYKHVPLMEDNPTEAVLTNVLGTKNLVDLSIQYGVSKFVMISTDKAVNPTNVMGCSKRVAEIYAQTMQQTTKTQFITTRFGNVLGSNGSVIPLFKKQIENGGPITITDRNITRYFMTIPEACQLVLEAGSMGNGGEIFVFDMGKSVKIYDLAQKMIKLSGLTLGKDIQIIFTGLRPGEKLYEELLTNDENTSATHHPQIMIGKVRIYKLEDTQKHISDLTIMYNTQNNFEIVKKLKEIVPEYISNNSIYSQLDQ
ncbi:MAG: FlaA1/EpsC-like NDP-sugar epimerase, partial [Flavobacteriales bacterium]